MGRNLLVYTKKLHIEFCSIFTFAGDTVEFRGPCGGFEYHPNTLDQITLLVAGAGITPALQISRSIMHNAKDNTKVTLLYYSETVDEILYREEFEKFSSK